MIKVAVYVASLLVLSTVAEARQVIAQCAAGGVLLEASLAPPVGFSEVTIATPDGATRSDIVLKVSNGSVSVPAVTLAAWRAFAAGSPSVGLLWRGEKAQCIQALTAAAATAVTSPEANSSGLGGATRPASENCTLSGQQWLADIVKSVPNQRPTVIVFRGPNACYRSDSSKPAAHGEPIYVGVLTANVSDWLDATTTFTPCDIEPSAPSIQESEKFPSSLRATAAWSLVTSLPRSCWNDAVTIAVKGATDNAQAGLVLQQYPRYRATVHLGTIVTELHEAQFGLRPDGTQKRVFNKGPVGKGPEYTASIVFYSVLRYVPSLFGGRAYKGREIRNEQGILDRIGATAGVGLRNPFKRFVFGATFEVIAGVNVMAGRDVFETSALAGVVEDSVFVGEEAAIPVTRSWKSSTVLGVTFDLAYAAKLFK